MVETLLLQAAQAAAPASPTNGWQALTACAAALGAVAIALREGTGRVPRLDDCECCAALRDTKPEQVAQLLRHHLEVHRALFGSDKALEGVVPRFALLESTIKTLSDHVRALHEDLQRRRDDDQRRRDDALNRILEERDHTNPGTRGPR